MKTCPAKQDGDVELASFVFFVSRRHHESRPASVSHAEHVSLRSSRSVVIVYLRQS